MVRAKHETKKWNTTAFRAKLASIVDLKEEVERTITPEKSKNSPKRDAHHSPQASSKPPKASAVFGSAVQTMPKALQKCHFCRITGHWSTDCRKHGTFEQRSEKVKELQLCFRCLAAGHLSSECRSTRAKCFNCDSQQHHTALCSMVGTSKGQDGKRTSTGRWQTRQVQDEGQALQGFAKGLRCFQRSTSRQRTE